MEKGHKEVEKEQKEEEEEEEEKKGRRRRRGGGRGGRKQEEGRLTFSIHLTSSRSPGCICREERAEL